MAENSFKDLADQVIGLTKQGMELFTEVERLHQLAKQLPKIEAYAELLKEIFEKEKLATDLIRKATVIQRDLINKQRGRMEALLNDL